MEILTAETTNAEKEDRRGQETMYQGVQTNKRKRKTGIVLGIMSGAVLLAAAGVFITHRALGWFPWFGTAAKNETTYSVRSEIFSNIIEIAGTISAAKEQKLQAAGTGTVTSVTVHEGDLVNAGQLILQLDDTEQRYNLAKHDFDMQQLRLTGSPRELTLMTTQRAVLLQRIKDRQIIANFNGVIAEFTAAAGDVFEAKDAVGVIIDRSFLKATVEVAESDAPKLKVGQSVTLKFPAAGNKNFEGYVNSFPAVAVKTSRGASVVNAEIRFDNPPDIILPNYSFTGEIEISPPQTFLLVERAAIKIEVDGESRKSSAEKIQADGSTERVDVQIAPYGREFVRILGGLHEGDVLKAQEQAPISGQMAGQERMTAPRMNNQNSNSRQSSPQMMLFR